MPYFLQKFKTLIYHRNPLVLNFPSNKTFLYLATVSPMEKMPKNSVLVISAFFSSKKYAYAQILNVTIWLIQFYQEFKALHLLDALEERCIKMKLKIYIFLAKKKRRKKCNLLYLKKCLFCLIEMRKEIVMFHEQHKKQTEILFLNRKMFFPLLYENDLYFAITFSQHFQFLHCKPH